MLLNKKMRWGGLEPPRLAAHGPQPCLSANSSTSAHANAIIIGYIHGCKQFMVGEKNGNYFRCNGK